MTKSRDIVGLKHPEAVYVSPGVEYDQMAYLYIGSYKLCVKARLEIPRSTYERLNPGLQTSVRRGTWIDVR